jgi:selenide,water dikinase
VDFFTPIVDDPYTFGMIAAANALSDIYAMGAEPITALNLVGFPLEKLDSSILKDILRGGMDKLAEAGVPLVGGHSIDDLEVKYGLAVTGIVHPDRVLTKQGARAGDKIVLTKALGTGIIATALKADMASEAAVQAATESMLALNKNAAQAMRTADVHGCTDITGFGLIGHAREMARESTKALVLYLSRLPLLPEALAYAGMGLVPGGTHSNRSFYEPWVIYETQPGPELRDLLYDPQTSGGLFITIADDGLDGLLAALYDRGVAGVVIGEVLEEPAGRIIIRE